MAGEHSYREITTQGAAWQGAVDAVARQKEVLQRFMRDSGRREHLCIGCGSTHYLALFAAGYLTRVTGRRCRGLPSSELALQTDAVLPRAEEAPLVIALSRSGETSETIMAVEKMRARGGAALTIGCYGSSPLAAASDAVLEVPEGREESYAQTRSFAGMLVATQALAALVAEDAALGAEIAGLPILAENVIAHAAPLARRVGQDESIRRITYLGSGPLFGLASEATVKMKEMALSVAEPYHFMEFRHGPMSLVDGEHLVVALLSEGMREYEQGVLEDLRARGARIVVVGNHLGGPATAYGEALDLDAPVSERACPVLYLPFLQLLAYYRSLGRGLDPDRPRHVVMAIKLDGVHLSP